MYTFAIKKFLQKYNYPLFSPKAVFFDMDGVLFDSMPGHAYAWVKAMNQVGLPFTAEDAYKCEGRPGTVTIGNVIREVHGREATDEEKKDIYRIKSEYFDEYGEPKAMPYAYELLKKIKSQGLQILVVTGSAQPSLLNNLEIHFPGIFEPNKMVTAFDVKYGKPNPEPFLMALKKSGVQPWEVIAVDNAILGVQSASTADMFTLGLNTGPLDPQLLTEAGADVVLNSMKDFYENWDSFYVTVKQ